MPTFENSENSKDAALAEFTDVLLAGEPLPEEGERPPLAGAVEALARIGAPQTPPSTLYNQVHKRVRAEWAREHPSGWARLFRQVRGSAKLTRRWSWVAMGGLAVVLALVLVLMPSQSDKLLGTAAGPGGAAIWVIGIVCIAAVAVIVGFLSRH